MPQLSLLLKNCSLTRGLKIGGHSSFNGFEEKPLKRLHWFSPRDNTSLKRGVNEIRK
jgi:hypothetical protein